jgi:hypothetical protein
LNCDRDAARWAREFNDVLAKEYNLRVDEGWLIGWFANAMMCGEDTYRWRQEKAVSERTDILQVLPLAPQSKTITTTTAGIYPGTTCEGMHNIQNAAPQVSASTPPSKSLRGDGPAVAAFSTDKERKLSVEELESWLGLVEMFSDEHVLLHGAAGEDAMNIRDLRSLLSRSKETLSDRDAIYWRDLYDRREAQLKAAEAALSARGEPVAWRYTNKRTGDETFSNQPPDRVSDLVLYDYVPLYVNSKETK